MKPIDPKNMLSWLSAAGCSVGLHVVVIAIFVLIGGNAPQPVDPAVAQSGVSSGETTENPADPGQANPETETPPTELDPVVPSSRPSRPGAATRAPSTSARPALPAGEGPVKTKSYTVKPGDNLTHLARKCGSTPAELAKLNGVDLKKMADLKVGQTIKIKDNDPK